MYYNIDNKICIGNDMYYCLLSVSIILEINKIYVINCFLQSHLHRYQSILNNIMLHHLHKKRTMYLNVVVHLYLIGIKVVLELTPEEFHNLCLGCQILYIFFQTVRIGMLLNINVCPVFRS